MKKLIYSLVFVLIFFNPLNTFSLDKCTTSELKRLKELANNVEFKTEYEFATDMIIDNEYEKKVFLDYSIKIFNYNSDLKISYKINNSDIIYNLEPNQVELEGLSQGSILTFYIYSYTNNLCTNELLKTKSISLKNYNNYYYFNKDKCNDYQDFEYCQEFLDITEKDFQEIDKLLDEYKKSIQIEDDIEDLNNVSQYYILIIITIILMVICIVFILIKISRKQEKI